MDVRELSLMTASQLVVDIYTDVAVVLRLWQTIMHKLSHFDFAVVRENLLSQAEFTLCCRAEALGRLTAWEIENVEGLDAQRTQVSGRQPHLGR
jgi:hypothetical protein